MPDHPGFNLSEVKGRSIVRLRVRPDAAELASQALQLPWPLQWQNGEPRVCWLGPDQWLFTSDSQSAQDIIRHIDQTLSTQLHAATDMSSGNGCFTLTGLAARKLLAMGCGIDMHPDAFMAGQCVRTNFALVPLFIVAVGDDDFELFFDRSYARYLENWITDASKDPVIYN